jgi:hypothetical protein
MSRARTVATFMLGKGWFTADMLGRQLNVPNFEASQAMQCIRRSPCYTTEERREDGLVYTMVTAIDGFAAPTREDALWNLALFGKEIA